MNEPQFAELMMLLDNTWGGVDEGREAGYRWLLEDEAADDCLTVVREMARGQHRAAADVKWLPKGPEIKAALEQLRRGRAHAQRLAELYAAADRVALAPPAKDGLDALPRGRRAKQGPRKLQPVPVVTNPQEDNHA